MGWKYEVSIWQRKLYQVNYEYVTVYQGNSIYGMLRSYWANRSNGCVKLEVRR
jgi:hypothetical protein